MKCKVNEKSFNCWSDETSNLCFGNCSGLYYFLNLQRQNNYLTEKPERLVDNENCYSGWRCNCVPLWHVLCNRFLRDKEINHSQQAWNTDLNLKSTVWFIMFSTDVDSEVDWVALCCRQLYEWVLMSREMKRAVREMTTTSRTHRLNSLLLLSALFTLHTWAGIQINLQCCHRMLNIHDEYFIFPAADWSAFVRRKISRSPERDISYVCPSLYCTVSTGCWLKCAQQ